MKYIVEQIITTEALSIHPREYFEHKIRNELGDKIARSEDVKLAWIDDPTLGAYAYKLCAGVNIEDSKPKTASLKDSLTALERLQGSLRPYADFDVTPYYTSDDVATLSDNLTQLQSLGILQSTGSVFIDAHNATSSSPTMDRLKDLEKFLHILAKRQVQPDSVTKKEQHFISQILAPAIEEVKKEWS